MSSAVAVAREKSDRGREIVAERFTLAKSVDPEFRSQKVEKSDRTQNSARWRGEGPSVATMRAPARPRGHVDGAKHGEPTP